MSRQNISLQERSRITKLAARETGFTDCGIAKARRLSEYEPELRSWLDENLHGQMNYMENHYEKRLDPRKLVPGTKSIISLLYNYYPREFFPENSSFKISRYAIGKDYHFVLKNKMREMVAKMLEQLGDFNYRVFVDSAPVLERAWAREAGLGWIGKNTMLINPQKGSFFFLAEIFADLEMDYDQPMQHDHCVNCNRCVEACPTGAISPYRLDASRCISYLTIENKETYIPEAFRGSYDQWVFGCDICQEVCPWNKFSLFHREKEFEPHPHLFEMNENDWINLPEDKFRDLFRKSAVKRTKYQGLQRNIHFLVDPDAEH